MGIGQRVVISVPPGVNKDDVSYTATQYTDANRMRFYKGYPQKIGGWARIVDERVDDNPPYFTDGVPRSMYSVTDLNGRDVTLIGTTVGLDVYLEPYFNNITPVQAARTSVKEIATNFVTTGASPITTTAGSSIVSINVGGLDAYAFLDGDMITVGGALTVGGIPALDLNGTFTISDYNHGGNSVSYDTGFVAISSGSGGGMAVTIGSQLLSVTIPSVTGLHIGQDILIQGAVAMGGLTAPQINISNFIRTIDLTNKIITIATDTAIATSSASQGTVSLTADPVSVIIGSDVVTLYVGPSLVGLFTVGQTVIVEGITGTIGGVNSASMNGTFVLTNVDMIGNTISYVNSTMFNATGSATGGGADVTVDTAVTIQFPIAAGFCDYGPQGGYGAGIYNTGTYGTPRTSAGGGFVTRPQIWSFDRYGQSVVMCPSNQTPIYYWDIDVHTLPARLDSLPGALNVPAYANYVFTANNQIIVFGGTPDGQDGNPNRVTTSAIGQPANFTAITSFEEDVEGCGRLIAHAFVKNQVLIFTESNVKKMVWFPAAQTWIITDLLSSDGLIGPKAVISFNDVVMWVGQVNWYIYNGSIVSVIPNNNIRQWFYNLLDQGMKYKVFVWQNISFNEIWVQFPADNGTEANPYIYECNNYVIWSYQDGHFTNGMLNRTCSENPTDVIRPQLMGWGSCALTDPNYPQFENGGGYIYEQELNDSYADDGNDMTGYLVTNYAQLNDGGYTLQIERIMPSNTLLPITTDATSTPLYNMTVFTKDYDQQPTARYFPSLVAGQPVGYVIANDTQKVEVRANGRQWGYRFDFTNQVGFRIEKYLAELKPTTLR